MQSFPFAAPSLGAGGQPVPGIPHVPGPFRPQGVTPGLTQYPTAPPQGYLPAGFPMPNPYAQPAGAPVPQGTYQQAPFQGANVNRMPGPAMLGPAPAAGTTGGVAGVAMGQVAGVPAPAATGGPHSLPPLPQLPLPQGFPNPFDVQHLQPGAPNQAPQPGPGSATVTGPQGYLPGLGYFGQQGAAPGQSPLPGPFAGMAPNAFPVLPGAQQQVYPQTFPQAQAYPGAAPQPQAFAQPQPQAAPGQAQASPFWLQLAWQLVQTPAVRTALGDQFEALLRDDSRVRTLQVATGCLVGQELQQAFRAMAGGTLEQTRFTELFAERLKAALRN